MSATATIIKSGTERPKLARFQALGSRRGRYGGHGEDYVGRFYRLVRRWRADTAYMSSFDEMFSHPAFQAIVGMGTAAVPLVIAEVQRTPDWLIAALSQITGDDPVSDDDRGNLDAMISAWSGWFRRRR